ncbi:UNVERIFIED_CONTAM: hypothetical protein PYX00_008860 [Menopon gallinae]|uniref:SPARC-related modular calcium-binding protein 2 n=1 Tax=Menopon gallinae TaxID=328185 RepID=A0AAW2H9Q2_9NEOP
MKNQSLAVIITCIVTVLSVSFVEAKDECAKTVSDCENHKRRSLQKVCGTDHVTYASQCHLEVEVCKGSNVAVKHTGRCRMRQPCFRDLARHQKLQKGSGSFMPKCLNNGLYAPVQCHRETGYCWCVTPNGKPIQNTPELNPNPRCSKKLKTRRRASSRNNREFCGPADKQKFSENLMNLFRAEYGKDLNDNADTAVMNQKILNWKFQSMDKNDDDFLQRSEYKISRRLKKLVKPKKCAKTFARLCDSDRDLKISKDEWSACLGVSAVTIKASEVASLSGQLAGFEDIKRKEEPDANDCLSDRQAVLSEQRSSNLYVPECTADGRYNRIQCYKSTGYCWCVHEDDGKPIPGTWVKDQPPKCDSIPLRVRPMKGCPGEKKRIFLIELIDFLANNILAENGTQYSVEKVASLSFSSLDANNNKYLERKEWKTFRALVANYKNLRRCGKRLPRFCDVNNDRRISMTEWSNCLDHQRMSAEESSPADVSTALKSKVRGPKGQNPLVILKDD